jgi:hypothetical protein
VAFGLRHFEAFERIVGNLAAGKAQGISLKTESVSCMLFFVA